MISKKQFEQIREEFGTVSSWAVWASQQGSVKSGTGDISMFNDDSILNVLNPNYVFVGLNASSTHEQKNVPDIRVWGNFHSTDNRRQNDFKLRYALKDTPYWGSYITDIIKRHAEVDSNKVSRFLIDHPEVVKENIEIFNHEMDLLGTKPALIALGNKVYEILITYLRGMFTIVKVKHYSYTIGKEDYRREVIEALKSI